MANPIHMALHEARERLGIAQDSWMYDCTRCGRWFHTCGDNPEAHCPPCRKQEVSA